MFYSQHTDYCFAKELGGNGLPAEVYDSILSNTEPVVASLKNSFEHKTIPLLAAIKENNDIALISEISSFITDYFENLVVLAIGGGSINGQVYVNFAEHIPSKVKISFIDNIDPYSFENKLRNINFKNTAFLVVSKSGNDIETLAATLSIIDKIKSTKDANYKFHKHFFFITENKNNPIRELALELKSPILDHLPVSGRFATLTSAGLLIASVAGLSPREIRHGALHTLENKMEDIAIGSALVVGLLGYCYNINVLLTFQDSLSHFGKWYSQLISESLGKKNRGITPFSANGILDQHGLLQLFLDGPSDKFFTFISHNLENKGHKISTDNNYPYLHNKILGDITHQIQKNTISDIVKKGCPTRIFKIDNLTSPTIGALLMHFTLETIVTAKLLQVNPFTRPSFEESKIQLKKMMSSI